MLIAGIYLSLMHISTVRDPAAELAQRLEKALEEQMLDKAQSIARSQGHRYDDAELNMIGAVFEKWDLPPELGRRIREWENGGITFPMGVTRLHRAILATAYPSVRQAEGAARLWDRGVWFFVLARPDVYKAFRDKHGPKGEPEQLVRMYPTLYTNFMLDEIWKPRINRKGMKDFIIEGLKTRKGST